MCKLGVIPQKRLKIQVKLLLSANWKSYAASIDTTTDDLEWPRINIRIARYLYDNWACLWIVVQHLSLSGQILSSVAFAKFGQQFRGNVIKIPPDITAEMYRIARWSVLCCGWDGFNKRLLSTAGPNHPAVVTTTVRAAERRQNSAGGFNIARLQRRQTSDWCVARGNALRDEDGGSEWNLADQVEVGRRSKPINDASVSRDARHARNFWKRLTFLRVQRQRPGRRWPPDLCARFTSAPSRKSGFRIQPILLARNKRQATKTTQNVCRFRSINLDSPWVNSTI